VFNYQIFSLAVRVKMAMRQKIPILYKISVPPWP